MRVAVVTGSGRPIQVTATPLPEPGPGQIQVRIEASWLRRTDINTAGADWPVKPTFAVHPPPRGRRDSREGGIERDRPQCASTYQTVKASGVTPDDRVVIFWRRTGSATFAQQYAQIFDAATTNPVAAIEAVGGADVAVVLAAEAKAS